MGRRLGPTYGSKRSPESPQRPTNWSLATLILIGLVCIGPSHGQWISGGYFRMRLSAVGTSPTRGQNLVAQLVPEHPGTADTLLVHFPAHSFTRKEAELVRLFRGSVKRSARSTPLDPDPTRMHLYPADSLDIVLKVPRRNMSFRLDEWQVVRVTTK
ncbi:MAG TPA: hypothetical protein PLF80_01435 [Flavobacteriales bacterium]|nr:hypothetical protein [Flavobacteriales bacterium]